MMNATAKIKRIVCALLVSIVLLSTAAPALAVPRSTTLAPYATSNYVVIVSGLNVRTGPGMGYAVRTVVKRGGQVSYISNKYGWWKVRLADGTTGWVDKQYLSPVTADTTGAYVVTASGLNVRKLPKTSAKRITTLKKGAVVTVTKLNGDWGYIPAAGGWAALKYLSATGSTKTTATITKGILYSVTADRLNVRRSGSMSGKVIAILTRGTKVWVTKVSGSWAYVSYSQGGSTKYGWVASKYLKK